MLPILAATPVLTSALGALGSGGAGAAVSGAGGAIMKALPMLSDILGAGSGGPMGSVKGLVQMLSAGENKRDANALMPGLYDPMQMALLDEIQQKSRSLNSGSSFAADMGAIDATTAGTQQAITQVTGGNVAGTIEGLLAAQTNANRAKNQVLGQADQQNYNYTALGTDLQNRISARAMELQLAMSQQNRVEWGQNKQDGWGNVAAGAALADPGKINWMEILQRHSSQQPLSLTQAPAQTTPMQDARMMQPIQNVLSPDSGFGDVQAPALMRNTY